MSEELLWPKDRPKAVVERWGTHCTYGMGENFDER